MALLALCDAMLDPFPYGGGISSLEGFTTGLPVVTLPGRIVTGRLTLQMYRIMALPSLVAGNQSHYVALAVRLGVDRAFREEVAGLRNARRLPRALVPR